MDAVSRPPSIKCERITDSPIRETNNPLTNSQICRLCLCSNANHNIFDEQADTIDKIQLCCALEILQNDGLPDHICTSCIETLEISSNFRLRCQESDKILRENPAISIGHNNYALKIENKVKQEFYFADYGSDHEYENELIYTDKVDKKENDNVAKTAIKKERHNSLLCTVCGRCFEKRSTYHSHMRSHRNETIVFNCKECPKTFNRKAKLQDHLITHYGVKNIKCNECDKMFTSKAYVQKHISKVHRKKFATQCPVCKKGLADGRTLKHHMKIHTGQKDFECTICRKQFTFKISLEYHIRTHTGEKPFACRFCQKRFSDLKSKSDHELLHTGQTPYDCPICKKGFAQLSNMKSHFRYNHKGQNIKDYPSFRKRKNQMESGSKNATTEEKIITVPSLPESMVPVTT